MTDYTLSEQAAGELSNTVIGTFKRLMHIRNEVPRLLPGVEPATYPVLFRVSRGECRVTDLAAELGADASTVSRHVTTLANHGLIAKTAGADDKRVQQVALTPAGVELLAQIHAQRHAWFGVLFADWPEQDIKDLSRLLERFSDSVERHAHELINPTEGRSS
ncbi:MAG: MarR family winged helix-turn-helix transcriptional regulator [Propionibacteriaceae bacterium]|nr:winged helix-turn-helix transcriptional regulator [Micropruina sp.]